MVLAYDGRAAKGVGGGCCGYVEGGFCGGGGAALGGEAGVEAAEDGF